MTYSVIYVISKYILSSVCHMLLTQICVTSSTWPYVIRIKLNHEFETIKHLNPKLRLKIVTVINAFESR